MEKIMKSITIHGLDDSLDTLIRKKAQEENLSLNKTIKKLLAEALGLSDNQGRTAREEIFSDLCGVWTTEDKKEFSDKIVDMETVDPGDWT